MSSFTSRISAKGQIVIPTGVQHELSLEDGVVVNIRVDGQGAILEKQASWVEATRGALSTNHPQIEPDELEALIEATALLEMYEKYGELS